MKGKISLTGAFDAGSSSFLLSGAVVTDFVAGTDAAAAATSNVT